MLTTIYHSLLDLNPVPFSGTTTTLIYCLLALSLWLIKQQQQQQQQHQSRHGRLEFKSTSGSSLNPTKLNESPTTCRPSKFTPKPLPTPPPMPLIGHIHLLRDYQHNPWEGFEAIRREYGDAVSLKMGIHPMVLVSSIELMREILLKKGDVFCNRPNFPRHHIVFGGDKENSLALCNWTNVHRDRRKLCKRGIVPNRFSFRNQLLEEIISNLVVNFVESLASQEPNQGSNLTPPMKALNPTDKGLSTHYYLCTKVNLLLLTSDIFMDFLCNERHLHTDPEYREFVQGCDFVFWDINQCYLIDFLPSLTSFGVGFSYLKKLKHVTDYLRGYIDDKIFEPRLSNLKKLRDTAETNVAAEWDEQSDTGDYLDSLIQEYLSGTTSMSLADYKVAFADLLAGHAAVTNILARLLGHLALDRQLQDQLADEANKTGIQHLNYQPSLPITEASLQEALRIASSPIVPHVAREDTSIGEFFVPRGSTVLFNNYHLNISEELWEEPLKFNPWRFLERYQNEKTGDEELRLHIPKHFIPFSVGMRMCLGYKMVEKATIVAVANLCRKFVIEADDEDLVRRLVAPRGCIALDPDAECFKMKLFPRD